MLSLRVWFVLGCALAGCATTPDQKVDDTDPVDSARTSDTDVQIVDTVDTDVLDVFDYDALPEMVTFAPGSFTMGSPESEVARTEVEAAHTVTLTYAFELGTYEVMQGQAEAWTGVNPSYWGGCRRCPVESVSWHDAAFVANLLSQRAELPACYTCAVEDDAPRCIVASQPNACLGYRLPTEAEWEYAARSQGTQTGATLSGGGLVQDPDRLLCSDPVTLSDGSNLADQAWFCGNSDGTPGNTTHAVGQRTATDQGVHDVLGNVWEWCHDGWQDVLDADASDPTGLDNSETKVVRGGGWNSTPGQLRLSVRTESAPGNEADNLGFRLARTLPAAE